MTTHPALTAASRLAAAAALLALLSVLPWLSGRDPARSILRAQYGEREPDPAALTAIRDRLHLDDGPLTLSRRWLTGLTHGDLGTSWVSGHPVAPTVWQSLAVSLTLMGAALAVALTVTALLTGRRLRHGPTRPRPGGTGAALAAVPEFLLGTLLLLTGAVWLRWLPPFGWSTPAHLVLPALALGIPAGGLLGRLADDALPGAYREPWTRTWRAAGLPWRTLAHGALRRCLPPLFPQLALVVVGLVGGAVAVEILFAIPGLGRVALGAATAQDLPLLQGAVLALLAVATTAGALAATAHRLALGPARTAAAIAAPPPPDPPTHHHRRWLLPAVLAGLLGATTLAGLTGDPTAVDLNLRLAGPTLDAPFGHDALGRDILARLGHGALHTIGTATAVNALALLTGLAAGLLPRLSTGAVEVANTLPPVIAGLLVAAALGPSTTGAAIAVAATAWAPLAAHTAALVQEERATGHVQASRMLGASPTRILRTHVLPGVLPAVTRHTVLRLPGTALAIASLSFVGLGAQPPTPEWGLLLAEAMPYVERAPWAALAPATALALLGAFAVTTATTIGTRGSRPRPATS
ncbi:ABC transporter permease subunit [Micromonospora sp. CB01531]|uniref:ABC transporter permease subunit n=1 Tax=Micromonospora sp. CB01531 TaxID=1718947 RepID=UPI00093AA6D5|nr:ABC transporter permease subunit [Micromonospora sp. CB01531]OKI85149.1 ABC transporter permease [Micromonospora sp. CB01531]